LTALTDENDALSVDDRDRPEQPHVHHPLVTPQAAGEKGLDRVRPGLARHPTLFGMQWLLRTREQDGNAAAGAHQYREIRVNPDSGSTCARCPADADRPSVGPMTNERTHEPSAAELARLREEIRRYLAAVDEFRRLGCEPRWRTEEARS
jgi:hypothetical protein